MKSYLPIAEECIHWNEENEVDSFGAIIVYALTKAYMEGCSDEKELWGGIFWEIVNPFDGVVKSKEELEQVLTKMSAITMEEEVFSVLAYGDAYFLCMRALFFKQRIYVLPSDEKMKVDYHKITKADLIEAGVSLPVIQKLDMLYRECAGKALEEIFTRSTHKYGKGRFYQSYEPLGIIGSRNTSDRLKEYEIETYLTKDKSVLDIGCNCGFFDLSVAGLVKTTCGIEVDEELLRYGKLVRRIMGIQNSYFINSNFNDYKSSTMFDIIFSFAVHAHIGMSFEEYGKRLYELSNENGIVVFESHNIKGTDREIMENIKKFCDQRFDIEFQKQYCNLYHDGEINNRRLFILRKRM